MTREEAVEILSIRDNQGMPITWQNGFVEAYDMAIEALERQRGEWLHYDEGDFDYDYKCSLCGYAVWDNSDYCPGCGADMRGDDD